MVCNISLILVAILKEELNILDKEKEKKLADTKVSDGKLYAISEIICFAFIFLSRNMNIFTLMASDYTDCVIYQSAKYCINKLLI